VLDGFTITGGNANGSFPFNGGGGMHNRSGRPTVTNCTFSKNAAVGGGGGMSNSSSRPTLTNCTFAKNFTAGRGGGLSGFSLRLVGCTFIGNVAEYGGGMRSGGTMINCTFIQNSASVMGGAISSRSSAKMTNCTFTENTADSGGAVWFPDEDASPTVINCIFRGNLATWAGGGIYLYGRPTFTECTFSTNSAKRGGGVFYADGAYPTLTNCTFTSNLAEEEGGAMYSEHSGPMLTNCIVSGNSARRGGGIFDEVRSATTLLNCTFADNSAIDGSALAFDSYDYNWPSNITGTNCIFWGGGNQIWSNDNSVITITYSDVEGGWLGVGNIDAGPCFVEPGYWDANGVWVDGDYHLLPDSPCINAGDPNYVAEPNETDLDGRPRLIGGRIDMGAYESPIPAEVRIVPRTINLVSKGKSITCYIRLPEDYDVAGIDPNSVLLEGAVQAASLSVDEGKQVVTARFSREKVQEILNVGEVELTISGQLTDGTIFEATDVIRVKDKASRKTAK
jgi:predicted outer membrane repeat protein